MEADLPARLLDPPAHVDVVTRGAELRIPRLYYYVMQYVTPTFLIVLLVAFIFKPAGGWERFIAPSTDAQSPAWEWAPDSMIGRLLHKDLPLKDGATPEEARFNEQLKFMRTADRCVMVAAFLGFAALVSVAWAKRAKRGERQ